MKVESQQLKAFLLDADLVDEVQFKKAQEKATKTNQKIGDVLISENLITQEELIKLEDQYGAHNYHPLDVILTRGEGIWVYDVDGNKFLDFLAAYSSVNQGHCHPRIVKALTEQAQKLTITSLGSRYI